MGPSSAAAVATVRSMSSTRVRSPRIFTVRTPCASAMARATSVSVWLPPYSDGPVLAHAVHGDVAAERGQALGEGTATAPA